MPTFLKEIKLTARKDHLCDLCLCTIHKGTQYRKQTNIYCGDIYDFKMHRECDEVAYLLDMYGRCDYDEGLNSDWFQEDINEYINPIVNTLPEYKTMSMFDLVQQVLIREGRCKNCEYCQFTNGYMIGCGYGIDGGQQIPLKCPKENDTTNGSN